MDIFERSMYLFMENVEFKLFNEGINSITFNILEHGYLCTGKEWYFENISSPFNRLYFVISGEGHINNKSKIISEHLSNIFNLEMSSGENLEITNSLGNINDESQPNIPTKLEGGNAYLIPLNTPCEYACDTELVKFYIHFRIEIIPGQDLFEGIHEVKKLALDTKTINEILQSAQSSSIGEIVKAKGMMMKIIGDIISSYPDKIEQQLIIAKKYLDLYTYIKNNCFADLRIKNLAGDFGVPHTNLSKNFKNDTGITLKQYIDNKIIQKAQELLLTTTKPVKTISADLHFLDEFHFSRFFKNKTGMSPNKYRQRNNNFK